MGFPKTVAGRGAISRESPTTERERLISIISRYTHTNLFTDMNYLIIKKSKFDELQRSHPELEALRGDFLKPPEPELSGLSAYYVMPRYK